MPFACSICGEESTQICARCTKDACDNHLCPKCRRCSDCCECEVALDEPAHEVARPVRRAVLSEPESAPLGPEPTLETAPAAATDAMAEEALPTTDPEPR